MTLSGSVLIFLDWLCFLLHVVVVIFNLFGWLFQRCRRLHLLVILITAASWFLLGYFFGLGYCFLTDWHWQVKEMRGIHSMPNSFIVYMFQLCHVELSPSVADWLIAGGFFTALIGSVVLNIWDYRSSITRVRASDEAAS